ncbi:c-type cytochrome [Anaerolineales bacterium HSG6]|nr:c-type cytochrome [Anaerolineales bacterium HSG6]MDM8531874.1 c-type cytochrome [Anaerolineales bacterium HSG25]
MKTGIKWGGIALVVILGLVMVVLGITYGASSSRFNAMYDLQVTVPSILTDEAAVERGKHIAATRGCTDCHGEDLAGMLLIDSGAVMGVIYASNLTPAGLPDYTDEDWVLAIQHGIGQTKQPIMIMPSEEYYFFGDEDLGNLIAYLKQLPPIGEPTPVRSIGLLSRVLLMAGELQLSAEIIDHTATRPDVPPPGATVEYGQYLATLCTGCHGHGYSGGPIPASDPEWPEGANLTLHETGLGDWTEADFFSALRDGTRPDGSTINPVMPRTIGGMSDEELQALWLFFQSLPPTAYGNR